MTEPRELEGNHHPFCKFTWEEAKGGYWICRCPLFNSHDLWRQTYFPQGTKQGLEPDGECFVCGEMTSSIAGNPSRWGFYFPHIDGQQKNRHYHLGCLYPILRQSRPSLPSLEYVATFIRSEMESNKRKPDYIFQKPFYPSSGVERMQKQYKQILEVATAILRELERGNFKTSIKQGEENGL